MSLSAEDDAIVAEMVLRRGWLDRDGLRRALQIQTEARAIELDERLLDILVTKGFLTDRQARELEEAVGLGRLLQPQHTHDIEGYRILEKLGQGGMGAVFKAVQLSMKRLVALKVLAPELAADPSYVERFEREARAIGRVSHANVVGGLDFGRSGDYVYYAMDFVEGRDLYEVLADGPLAVAQVLDIAEQMARALSHIESLGLVHRDIKPSNIILTHDGIARLCDLELARAPEDPSVTDTGIPVGTPHYAAPELALGRKDADIRADIYALGGTLYHLVTGQYPFKPQGGAPLLQQHLTEPLRPPIELRRDVPQPLSDLICRMMAKNPRERLQSAAALLEAVHAVRAALREAPEETPLPGIAPPADEAGAGPAGAAEAEVAPPSRLVPVLAWGAVYGVLVAILIGAVVWAVRARGRGTRALKPRSQAPPAAPGAASAVTPGAPATDAGAARRRQALVAEALAYEQTHPKAHEQALLKLRRAALAARDPKLADAVARRLGARRAALLAGSREAYNTLRARVQALRDRDAFGEALEACAAFPSELRYGATAERLSADVASLGAQAERRYLELATTGRLLLRQGKLDDGLEAYGKIAGLGLPWVEAEGARLVAAARLYAEVERRRLDELARRRAVDARRQSFGTLRQLFDSVSKLLADRSYGRALALCRAQRQKLGEGELADAVATVERRVRRLADLWALFQKNPPQVQGKRFDLYGRPAVIVGISPPEDNPLLLVRLVDAPGSPPHKRPLHKLPARQFADLATWALGDKPEAERAAIAGLIYLVEGDAKEARERLDRAQALGADVAAELRELDAARVVAEGLSAAAARDWKKARERLETALDQYGATMAVVLKHQEAYRSLRIVLATQGMVLPKGQPAASPLPVDLRRLALLPETRLNPFPPANPVDAYRATPLQRGSPAVLGLDGWTDYTLEVEWTPQRGKSFVVLFRLTEPHPGRFTYYFLHFDGQRLMLGRSLDSGVTALATRPCRVMAERRRHRAIISAHGSELMADVDRTYRLRAADTGLPRGNVALATSGGDLHVHSLSVLAPASKTGKP